MDIAARVEACAQSGFLAAIDAQDRARIAGVMRLQTFEDGAEVIAHRATTRDAYVALSGRAIATTFSRDGRAVSYRDLGPGDLFGEIAAIDALPRSAYIIAVGRLEVGAITWRDFDSLVTGCPGIVRALLRHLTESLRTTSDRLFENVALLMRERLIRELLRRAAAAAAGDEAELRPAPTHLELAHRIGSHREGVTKELAQLSRRGLVERRDGALHILSVRRLEGELGEERVD